MAKKTNDDFTPTTLTMNWLVASEVQGFSQILERADQHGYLYVPRWKNRADDEKSFMYFAKSAYRRMCLQRKRPCIIVQQGYTYSDMPSPPSLTLTMPSTVRLREISNWLWLAADHTLGPTNTIRGVVKDGLIVQRRPSVTVCDFMGTKGEKVWEMFKGNILDEPTWRSALVLPMIPNQE